MKNQFGVLFEKIEDADYPRGYYYAHIPSLGLTTHGLGIDGAKSAALDLLRLWIDEKKEIGEDVFAPQEILYSTLEID